ncbi:hypothetical protein [Xanthomonas euvesicatoria]|uniref:hypothetical protein n=1 Tax=Xanthomonas euvesicatoria TaxID=456327 RepID=UPI001C45C7F1|nr:hypothetical protein [Xanthomonas euvesicatoria]MBV6791825.1 hypothetical protein [Xanthomonas campestris pv. clerodendri]
MKGYKHDDLTRHGENAGVPDATCIRMTCDRGSIEARVTVDHAKIVTQFASLVAQDMRSDASLVEFIVDQIDGRATAEEAVLAQAHPGYAADVASKVAIFALGLLFKHHDLAELISASLQAGGHTIDIHLSGSRALVQIGGHWCRCKTHFMISGHDGTTASVH